LEKEEERVEHELRLDIPASEVPSRHRSRASARAAAELLLAEISDISSVEDISASGSDPEWDPHTNDFDMLSN